jgi:hypothetical protein
MFLFAGTYTYRIACAPVAFRRLSLRSRVVASSSAIYGQHLFHNKVLLQAALARDDRVPEVRPDGGTHTVWGAGAVVGPWCSEPIPHAGAS